MSKDNKSREIVLADNAPLTAWEYADAMTRLCIPWTAYAYGEWFVSQRPWVKSAQFGDRRIMDGAEIAFGGLCDRIAVDGKVYMPYDACSITVIGKLSDADRERLTRCAATVSRASTQAQAMRKIGYIVIWDVIGEWHDGSGPVCFDKPTACTFYLGSIVIDGKDLKIKPGQSAVVRVVGVRP